MSSEDAINKQLIDLQEETAKVDNDVHAYMRKLMTPVWNKRRDIVKNIPNFWSRAIENAPMLMLEDENDIESLGNLVDFHVEFDENRPDYRKVIASYKKNDVFKNETLTKEFIVDENGEGEVISKSSVEYHPGKEPKKSNKRKAGEDDGDDFSLSLLDWFSNDDLLLGKALSDDIFVNALEYFQTDEDEDEEDEEGKEYSLGESEEDEEDEEEDDEPSKKKARK